MDRVVRWFYGLPNIVGTALAIGGLALFIAGVIHGPLVLAIVAGLYVLGSVVTPRPKPISGFVDADGSLDAKEMRSALDKLVSQSDKRLPPDLAAKVEGISQSILDILPKVNASKIDQRDLFVLDRTVTDYLPSTINGYLTLPRAYANNRVVQDGKTAKDLLGEQLDLIAEKIDAISEAVSKDDLNNLLTQGRFLEDKFGKHDELNVAVASSK